MVDHRRFTEALAEFANNLATDYSIGDVLIQLSERAVQLLPVDGAGIMLRANGGLEFATATDEHTADIERMQVEFKEGPCTTAATSGEMVLVADLRGEPDPRFPTFAAANLLKGMQAVFAFPMMVESERIGALTLYRAAPGALSDEEVAAAKVLTDVASAYIVNSHRLTHHRSLTEQLQKALDARVVVEQAKGKVAGELGLELDEAYERMRKYARSRNLRIRTLAEQLVFGHLTAGNL